MKKRRKKRYRHSHHQRQRALKRAADLAHREEVMRDIAQQAALFHATTQRDEGRSCFN